MNRRILLPALFVFAMLFTACKKPMKPLGSELFKVNPNPLEAVGGVVNASIDGTFPEKYFEKNSVLTVTPVLKYEGGEVKGTPATFQGEKVKANDQVVPYKTGGAFKMNVSYPYKPEMAKSELYLEFSVTRKSKTYTLPSVKVADGVIATETLASAANSSPAMANDKFQKVIEEKIEASILFLIQQAELRKSELKGESVTTLESGLAAAKAAENKNIKSIELSAYASPDGALDLNTSLAEKREKNTQKFLNESLKKSKISTTIDSKFTAEDWDGFKSLMENSSIQDKDVILRVLSTYQDPAERETQIKNMTATFETIAKEILPQLRRSKLTASIDVIGKSDEVLANMVASKPSELTVEEILYAATLKGVDAKAAYKSATDLYPNDYRAYNNLGLIAFQSGNLSEAETWFSKAASKNANAPEVNMNQGLIKLAKGDKAGAQQSFGKSAGAQNLKEATALLALQNGEYAKAAREYGDTKSNNAAVAQIMSKDYNKAKSTLSAINNPDANTYYLMAVVGARTNNESMVISNLNSAVKADGSMAKKAANDIEFAKFASNSEFTKLVK